jgi:predicted DNA-binding transcriptional regulator YafY
MTEMTKTKRLDELKSRFNAGARFTVSKMMREFGITRRTANRDLQDLQELGVALEFEDLPDGHRQWYADIKSRKVLVSYSIRDVMSLFLGRRMFDFLENTSLEDSLNRVYRRVETQLSRPKDLANANKLYQKVYLVHEGPKKLPETAGDVLDEVLSGLLYEQRVKVHYVNHKGEDRRFTVCPYTLVAYKRGLYLLGKVEEWDGKVLVYSLERIKGAEWLKGDHFEYPVDFDPEKYFETALFIAPAKPVSVKLVFTEGTKPFIRFRKFHDTQKLKNLKDGKVQMTLKVPVNFETVNWILSFGANVEVVSPPELRELVLQELDKALRQYR